MMRLRYAKCVMLLSLLFMLATTGTVRGDLAPYLVTIGYDQVQTHFGSLTGAGQAIAVIDTGIDALHDSFALQAAKPGGIGITGINFNFSDNPPHTADNYSDTSFTPHGTFVTSVAVGQSELLSNGVTQTGLAPGADIVAVRVLDNTGSGSFSVINSGLGWIVQQVQSGNPRNIRVVNLSLGTAATFTADTLPAGDPSVIAFNSYVATLKQYDIPVICAAGNNFASSPTGLSFPAIVPDVISVGSTDQYGGSVSTFSNRYTDPNSNNSLDILAPGENIYGAYGVPNPSDPNLHNLYAIGSGTSFAAPQVAGSILLINELYFDLHSQYPTVDQLLFFLTHTGEQSISATDPLGTYNYPLLNIYHALQAVPEPISIVLLTPAMLIVLTVRPRRALPPLAA